jgi:hypothetical protein
LIGCSTPRFALCFTLAAAFLGVLGAGGWMVATELSATLKATADAERAIAKATTDLPAYVLPTLTQEVDDLGRLIVARTDAQVTAGLSVVKQSLTTADAKFDAALARYDATLKVVDERSGEALATVAKSATVVDGLRADLTPVLVNAAALVKDAQDSWDDLYDDTKALQQSALVATTQAAQVGITFNREFPKMVASAQQTNESVAGIATGVRETVDKFVHPEPVHGFWGHLKLVAKTGKDILVAALRGGVL